MAVGTAVTGLADVIDVFKELAGFVGSAVEMTVVAKIVLRIRGKQLMRRGLTGSPGQVLTSSQE